MSDQGQGPHQQQSQQYNASYAQHLAQFSTSPGVQNVVPSSKQNALDTDRPRGGGWTKGFPHNKRANAMFRMAHQQDALSVKSANAGIQPDEMYNISKEKVHDPKNRERDQEMTYRAELNVWETDEKTNQRQEVYIRGPKRWSEQEAVVDGEAIARIYRLDGEGPARATARSLWGKTYTHAEIVHGMQHRNNVGRLAKDEAATAAKDGKHQPAAEGWAKATLIPDYLVHEASGVHFCVQGMNGGKYFVAENASAGFPITKNSTCNAPRGWVEIDRPSEPPTAPLIVTGGACVRATKGTSDKLEMTVCLADLPKTARLAMKFPLGFLAQPSAAYALFSGQRNSKTGAEACAKIFHTKLLPRLDKQIYGWSGEDLERALKDTLREVNTEVTKSSNCFAGASCTIVLVVGEVWAAACCGRGRLVKLSGESDLMELIDRGEDLEERREKIENAGYQIIGDKIFHSSAPPAEDSFTSSSNEVERILRSPHAFDLLQIDNVDYTSADVKAAKRRLALKAHPDKQEESQQKDANVAFNRLEESATAVEELLSHPACGKEVFRVLHEKNPFSKSVAARIFGVEASAPEGEARSQHERVIGFLSRYSGTPAACLGERAVAKANAAMECFKAPSDAKESMLNEGVDSLDAIGLLDLRVSGAVEKVLQPRTASGSTNDGTGFSLLMLCGNTAYSDGDALKKAVSLRRYPKCLVTTLETKDGGAKGACCVRIAPKSGDDEVSSEPSAKRQKTQMSSKNGQQRVRHILLKHSELKQKADPMARNPKKRSLEQAEEQISGFLEKLVAADLGQRPALFSQLVRQHSECRTADQPGMLAGDLGWFVPGKGQIDPAIAKVADSMKADEISDIFTSGRGVHIIHRLA